MGEIENGAGRNKSSLTQISRQKCQTRAVAVLRHAAGSYVSLVGYCMGLEEDCPALNSGKRSEGFKPQNLRLIKRILEFVEWVLKSSQVKQSKFV